MPETDATEAATPDRLGLTIEKLNFMYEFLDYTRPESAIVSTAALLIAELQDEEIDHGIHRVKRECRRAIAKDILDRARNDEPIPDAPLEGLPRLNAALAKAQGEFEEIPKTRSVTKRYKDKDDNWKEYTFRYADLADILKGIRPSLSKYGLAVTQPFVRRQDGLYLVTQLRHASGEVLQSYGLLMDAGPKVNPQDFGSQHSYWRRYDVTGLVGVSAMEDDDGALASRTRDKEERGEKRNTRKTEEDKAAIKPGDPNRGHGNEQQSPEGNTRPATPATPAPTPVVTSESVSVKIAGKEEPQLMAWKKLSGGRVKTVTGILTAANKAKSKYIQVIVEGLDSNNKKQEGKEHQTAMLFHCFRTTLFDAAKTMPGKICSFYFDPAAVRDIYYQNIEEILQIDGVKFVDGKIETKAEPEPAAPEPKKEEPAASSPTGLFPDSSQAGTAK